MFLHANEAHVVTMQHVFKIRRILRITLVGVELVTTDKTVPNERHIVKVTHAMEARVRGHPLVTDVFVSMADMGPRAYHVSNWCCVTLLCDDHELPKLSANILIIHLF